MKFGASYNVFNGEELLASSIKCIRAQVDFISVVYQTKSNWGTLCSENLIPLLTALKHEGLIDQLYRYEPQISDHEHSQELDEVAKRNIGLELSRKAGCDCHISIDADEFYLPKEFAYMKANLKGYDQAYCQHLQYYKDSIYQLDPPEQEFVTTFVKINPETKFIHQGSAPVPVDPTRKTNAQTHLIFTREFVQMHHMSFVRNDIRGKLLNHPAKRFFADKIEQIGAYYDTWKYPEPVMWAGGNLLNVKKVKRQFKW